MIIFRADSSFTIGTGHIIRSLHLARLLKRKGHKILFICKDLPGNISHQIKVSGIPVEMFSADGEDLKLLQKYKPDWIVIDNYEINIQWQKQIAKGIKIFVIDDLMSRPHHCDVLLDQNYRQDSTPYKKLIPSHALLLAGPSYCLMSDSLKKPKTAKKISSKPEIISFFGGADSRGELVNLAENLIQSEFPHKISFIALQSHKHLEKLKSLKMPAHFSLLIDPTNWHELLSKSDFYIGSGGTVTWERLYLGTPGAVLAVADNQIIPSQELSDKKYQLFWGDCQSFDYRTASEKICAALKDSANLEYMSMAGLKLVDRFSDELAEEIFQSP